MQESSKPTSSPKKRGQKPYSPTAQQRKDVMLYKAGGIPEPAIAHMLGISQNTLRKHFEFELNCGRGVKLSLIHI